MKKIIMSLLFLTLILNTTIHSLKKNLQEHTFKIIAGFFYLKLAEHIAKKNIPLSTIATNTISHYCTTFLTTFAHECGHALAEKILYNSNIDIHIGSNNIHKSISLFPGVSLEGLSPNKGFAILQKNQ